MSESLSRATTKIPLRRIASAEIVKVVDTRTGRGVLLFVGLMCVTAGLLSVLTGSDGPKSLTNLFDSLHSVGGLIVPLLGVLVATSEWSRRTASVTFCMVPSRLRVVVAKLCATIVLGVATVVACCVLAVMLMAAASVFGLKVAWSVEVSGLVGNVLATVLFSILGFAFGLALRSSAVAIVGYLLLPMVWLVVSSLVPALAAVSQWFDLVRSLLPFSSGWPSGWEVAKIMTSSALWLGVPISFGTWRILREDIR